jgi:hypothetical protein
MRLFGPIWSVVPYKTQKCLLHEEHSFSKCICFYFEHFIGLGANLLQIRIYIKLIGL